MTDGQRRMSKYLSAIVVAATALCGCHTPDDRVFLRVEIRDREQKPVWGIITYIYDQDGTLLRTIPSQLNISAESQQRYGSDGVWILRGHSMDRGPKDIESIREGIRIISKRGEEVLNDSTVKLSNFEKSDYRARFFGYSVAGRGCILRGLPCIYVAGSSDYRYVKRIIAP